MAPPQLTAGNVGVGSSIAGGVIGALGSIATGISNQRMYDYQARLASINATISRQNADYAIQKGEQDAQRYGLQAGQRVASIVAAQASSGLDIRSGSAKDVQESQRTVTDMDLEQIRSNAAKTAYDFNVQATTFDNQATLDKYAGSNSMWAGMIGAGSSLIGSAGSVAAKWLQAGQLGLNLDGSSSTANAGYNVTGTPAGMLALG